MPNTRVTCRLCANLIIVINLEQSAPECVLSKAPAIVMELFLNLCWLSLLVPAWLLWRRWLSSSRSGNRTEARAVRPLVFLCALGCALVLLFPVISASDDLHAMRAEMEESSPGKRSVSQAGGEKASVWHSRWQNLSAIVGSATALGFMIEAQEIFSVSMPLPVVPSILCSGRGPPRFRLI